MEAKPSSPKGVFFLLLFIALLCLGVGMDMLPEVVSALENVDSRKKVRNKQKIKSRQNQHRV